MAKGTHRLQWNEKDVDAELCEKSIYCQMLSSIATLSFFRVRTHNSFELLFIMWNYGFNVSPKRTRLHVIKWLSNLSSIQWKTLTGYSPDLLFSLTALSFFNFQSHQINLSPYIWVWCKLKLLLTRTVHSVSAVVCGMAWHGSAVRHLALSTQRDWLLYAIIWLAIYSLWLCGP